MRKDKNKILTEYLISKGKENNMSAVQYALSEYSSEDFESVYYRKCYYEEHKENWKTKYKEESGKYVYILLDDEKVVWVGSTIYIKNRISQHKSLKRKFNTIIIYDYSNLNITEKEMRQIEYLNQNIYAKFLENTECRVTPYDKEIIDKIYDKIKNVKAKILRGDNVD